MPAPDHSYDDSEKDRAWRAFVEGWSRRGGTDSEPSGEQTAQSIFERWWELNA